MRDVLRGALGFQGFVVSDANVVRSLAPHGFAADLPDATARAIAVGIDAEMAIADPGYAHLPDLVGSGVVGHLPARPDGRGAGRRVAAPPGGDPGARKHWRAPPATAAWRRSTRHAGAVIGTRSGQHHTVSIGEQVVDLPIVPVTEGSAIALLVVFDQGSAFLERAAADLAGVLADARPDAVAGIATLGVPVAYALARALGLDDWVVLQKTRKIHLHDALRAPVRSITTKGEQELLLERERARSLAGRRVVVVDDVVSTGASVLASIALLRQAGAEVVAVATLLTEGDAWRSDLGEDAHLVRALGAIPGFERADDGSWTPTREG